MTKTNYSAPETAGVSAPSAPKKQGGKKAQPVKAPTLLHSRRLAIGWLYGRKQASKARQPKERKPIIFRDARDPSNALEWDGELNQKGRNPEWISARIADGTIEQFWV